MSVLVFLADNGEAKPVMVKAGDIIVPFRHTTDFVPEKAELMRLRKDGLHSVLNTAGIGFRQKDSCEALVDKLLEQWQTVMDKYQALAARLATHILVEPRFVNKRKSNDADLPAKFVLFGVDNFVKLGDCEKNDLRIIFHEKPLTDKNSVLRFNGKYLIDRTKSLAEYGFRYHNVVDVEVYDTDDEDLVGILNGEVQYTYTGDFEDYIQVNVDDGEAVLSDAFFACWDEEGETKPTPMPKLVDVRIIEPTQSRVVLKFWATTDTTVEEIKFRLTGHINLQTGVQNFTDDDFYLMCNGRCMLDEEAVKNYQSENDEYMSIVFKLRLRGGAPKVKKHYIKLSTCAPAPRSDLSFFTEAHATCETINTSGTINFEEALMTMSTDSLVELKEYLNTPRITHAAKIYGACEHMSYYKGLEMLQRKILATCEKLREMTKTDIEERYGGDIEALKEAVSNTLAVKRDRELGTRMSN